ncbi:MAG: hypothetical protein JJT95_10810 [Pararhodobacter sp.]|nr:hypothetical protein [Pararhodobacter sp.]
MPAEPANESIAHQAAAHVAVPARFALERLADPGFVGGWALGSMNLSRLGDSSVYRGHSLFDGSEAFVEFQPHPGTGLIDYHVGTQEARSPRVSIRVVPGNVVGLDDGRCLVVLMAWRVHSTPYERWNRTCRAHEAEILILKGQLESALADSQRREQT